jgi:RNA polymerase sigma factor (sigma-70 family)
VQQLESGQVERGWRAFVERYSPVLYRVVREFEADEFSAEECFVDLCAELAENDFARLRQFNPQGAASFETWLCVVASRLCIDWHRSRYGRLRPLESVKRLCAIEQELFELRFRKGLALHECLQELRQTHASLSSRAFGRHNANLNRALASRQHHALASQARKPGRFNEEAEAAGRGPAAASDPEAGLMRMQDRERLNQALSQLDPLQRLLIKLRFNNELSLKEVARMAGLKSTHSAQRQLRSALTELGALLRN